MNRLKNEKSPYLLQHANNPVDWYAWGPQALERARQEDKPIFLSIGYSTCHWCHVMERESFENPEVAKALNRAFVCIKVDREERPDLDSIYMTAVQAMTGHGGWPLSVMLTPQGKPFFGGTYFPPVDTPGRGVGMLTLISRVEDVWKTRRQDLEEQASHVAGYLSKGITPADGGPQRLGAGLLAKALESMKDNFDEREGGFSGAPKFPRPMLLSFLWRAGLWDKTGSARSMAARTLGAMAHGGIHDHLGGGFARYSTDSAWLVPHFEKMLYDNALLAQAYLEGYQVSGEPEFLKVLEGILEYVSRDLTSPDGAFYSAEDADSEGEEGLFYVWTPGEIEAVLGPKDAPRFEYLFGVDKDGNFEGRSILHLPHGRWRPEEKEQVRAWKAALLKRRSGRVRPQRDDKVITGWNGLMISAFARAGAALGRPEWIKAAASAAGFLLRQARGAHGLFRRWADGEARFAATSEDYAFLVRGLLDLFEADPNPAWLKAAVELNAEMLERFQDPSAAPLYFAQGGDASLLTRPKDGEDNAIPSANSMAVGNLLRLAEITGRQEWRSRAGAILEAFSNALEKYPMAFPQMLCGLDLYLAAMHEVVVLGDPASSAGQALLREVREPFLPHHVLVAGDPSSPHFSALAALAPLVESRDLLDGKPAAYVCQNQTCLKPTTDPGELRKQLKPTPPHP